MTASQPAQVIYGQRKPVIDIPLEAVRSFEVTPEPLSEQDDENDFPEGGLEAWLVVLGSFLGLIADYGLPNSLGAIEAYVSTNQLANVSTTAVSWVFSIYLFLQYGMGILSGAAFDSYGARVPLVAGTILFCGGLFATANSSNLYQFILAFGVCTGCGAAIAMTPLVSCVAHWFLRKRGGAASMSTMGGSLGGIIFPLMLRKLYTEVGWVWAIRILGFISLGLFTCSIFLTKARPSKLKPPKVPENSPWHSTALHLFKASIDFAAFKDLRYAFLCVGVTGLECALYTLSTYLSSLALANGSSESSAYLLLTVLNACAMPGRWVTGLLADIYGRFNLMVIMSMLSMIVLLVMLIPFGHIESMRFVFSAFYGFFTGAILSLSPICCGQISRTSDFGKRFSTMYFFVSFANLISMPIGGAIVGNRTPEGYRNLLVYVVGLHVLSIIGWTASRYRSVGWRVGVRI